MLWPLMFAFRHERPSSLFSEYWINEPIDSTISSTVRPCSTDIGITATAFHTRTTSVVVLRFHIALLNGLARATGSGVQ